MTFPPLIVPDVNVLVSGAILSSSPPSHIMRAWQRGDIAFALSDLILSDVQRVLTYPKVMHFTHLSGQRADAYVETIKEGSYLVTGTTPLKVSPDPDDDKLFACAVEAQADYIVSGDEHHVLCIPQYQGVQTISPADFVASILPQQRVA